MTEAPFRSFKDLTPLDAVDDVVELRRMAAYFRELADKTGASLLVAQSMASKNRQQLEQKTRGFSLLSRLSSDASAAQDPGAMAKMLAGHINSKLNMNRTVVLLLDSRSAQFSVLASVGYAQEEKEALKNLRLDPPGQVIEGRRPLSGLAPLSEAERQAFAALHIPHFMATPVVADNLVEAIIVTGRMREQQPFSPPLNLADLETLGAIAGFFGAYLARHHLVMRDRERLSDVERLVTERTAQIETQRGLLDDSLKQLHETQQQLIMREKLASLGEMMAGIAHEIQNPLNFVNNFSDLSVELLAEVEEMQADPSLYLNPGRRQELEGLLVMLRSNLRKVAEHGKRADSIVRNMLLHSRAGGGAAQICDLNALLAQSMEYARHAAQVQDPDFRVTITCDFDASLDALLLAPQEMSRVFVNLMSNAFYALSKRRLEKSGEYCPAMVVTSRRMDGMAEVRFRDNGGGIPEHIRSRIFSPFFTTKPPGEGTGLGLSLSYDIIVNGHGGSIEVASRENEYTEFIIQVPLISGLQHPSGKLA